jgi:hypothetical protein
MNSYSDDAKYKEMWEALKNRLERRVLRMKYSGDPARRNAYEDVLIVMEDQEEDAE